MRKRPWSYTGTELDQHNAAGASEAAAEERENDERIAREDDERRRRRAQALKEDRQHRIRREHEIGSALRGAVVGAVTLHRDPDGGPHPFTHIRLHKGSESFDLYVYTDPEKNGPGHLEIGRIDAYGRRSDV